MKSTKIKIIEQIKPNGQALFENANIILEPGKGIIDLSSATGIDYSAIKDNTEYIGAVVLPLEEFQTNFENISKYSLECCKGILVELIEGDPKQTFDKVQQAFANKNHILDFVYIPY